MIDGVVFFISPYKLNNQVDGYDRVQLRQRGVVPSCGDYDRAVRLLLLLHGRGVVVPIKEKIVYSSMRCPIIGSF